jgi:CBS domain-containing protein
MTAARILSRKDSGTITIKPGAKISEAIGLLSENNIGAVIVSDDGHTVAGILSERDIIHGFQRAGASLLETQVGDLMTTDIQTCMPSDTLRNLLAIMTERRVRHLPVIEDGRLAGIVSIGDVVKMRLDDLVTEAEALRGYISGA